MKRNVPSRSMLLMAAVLAFVFLLGGAGASHATKLKGCITIGGTTMCAGDVSEKVKRRGVAVLEPNFVLDIDTGRTIPNTASTAEFEKGEFFWIVETGRSELSPLGVSKAALGPANNTRWQAADCVPAVAGGQQRKLDIAKTTSGSWVCFLTGSGELGQMQISTVPRPGDPIGHLKAEFMIWDTAPEAGGAGPVVTSSNCGPAGGTAVVVIPEPDLTKLNVRDKPGGKVLSTIPEGAKVSIVGPCGSEPAAGFTASKQSAASGWCQIDSPVSGCVSGKYLQLGGSGGAAGLVPTDSSGR